MTLYRTVLLNHTSDLDQWGKAGKPPSREWRLDIGSCRVVLGSRLIRRRPELRFEPNTEAGRTCTPPETGGDRAGPIEAVAIRVPMEEAGRAEALAEDLGLHSSGPAMLSFPL